MKKEYIISKLNSIISEGKRNILESEMKSLMKEYDSLEGDVERRHWADMATTVGKFADEDLAEEFEINSTGNDREQYLNKTMELKDDEMLSGYLEAALWTNEEEIGSASIFDINSESRDKAHEEINSFMQTAAGLLKSIEPSQAGHDFWLTRNGHGTGFWDRGLGEVGEKLTEISKSFGTSDLYMGNDGELHLT